MFLLPGTGRVLSELSEGFSELVLEIMMIEGSLGYLEKRSYVCSYNFRVRDMECEESCGELA